MGTLADLFDSGDAARDENGDLSLRCQTAGFKPEEIKVELDGDQLSVTGEHRESKDGESVERKYNRVIRLPKELDIEKTKCELDSNGELIVQVPRKEALKAPKQSIPVTMKNAKAIDQPKNVEQ